MVIKVLDALRKYKSLIIIFVSVFLISMFLFGHGSNVNKPRSYAICLPGGHVTVDQKSEVVNDNKPWSLGVGCFGGRYDNRDFYGVIGGIQYKF